MKWQEQAIARYGANDFAAITNNTHQTSSGANIDEDDDGINHQSWLYWSSNNISRAGTHKIEVSEIIIVRYETH